MISVIVLVKDSTAHATDCLQSVIHSLRRLGIEQQAELILLDDFSEPQSGIADLFTAARNTTTARTRAIRFRGHRHYAYGVALGMSLAQRRHVLFLSHDMVIAPHCIKVLLETLARYDVGIVRPTSGHMDYYPGLALRCPFAIREQRDIDLFSALMARRFGTELLDAPLLIGDAMLIKRDVLDRLGVFDTQYFGFMADVDYGIRARRAGINVAIAKGAWLQHVGSVVAKAAGEKAGLTDLGHPLLDAAYAKFRRKWDPNLPEQYKQLHVVNLLALTNSGVPEKLSPPLYHPPIAIDPAVCDVLIE